MENITIGEIASAIGLLSVIIGAIVTIITFFVKWYKGNISNKITKIEKRIDNVEDYLNFLKDKKEQYEKMAQESKEEGVVLLEGLLACLESLKQGETTESVSKAITKINKYLLNKLRD